MIPLIDLKAQYRDLKPEIDAAIARVLESGNYVMGKEVEAFEQEFASFCGADYCVACSSGTDALYLALTATKTQTQPRWIITTPVTFYATSLAILWAGAWPLFKDIQPDGNIDLDLSGYPLSYRDQILTVHLYGEPAWVPSTGFVIEDSAQAHGIPLRGEIACFSFYPTKNLGAIGQAGALVSNNRVIIDNARKLREYGETTRFNYDHELYQLGGNFRMDELQAAILRVKLPYVPGWNDQRRRIAEYYKVRLAEIEGIRIPPASREHVYHIFAIFAEKRDELAKYLLTSGIQTSVRYPVPVHLQPAFKNLPDIHTIAYRKYQRGDFPVAEKWCDEVLTLPMYPELDSDRVDRVCEVIKQWSRL